MDRAGNEKTNVNKVEIYDDTIAKDEIPNAGKMFINVMSIGALIIITLLAKYKQNKLKDVK